MVEGLPPTTKTYDAQNGDMIGCQVGTTNLLDLTKYSWECDEASRALIPIMLPPNDALA